MTHYYFITSNIEMNNAFLNRFKVDYKEKFVGSKYNIQFQLYYNPDKELLSSVYDALMDCIAVNENEKYMIIEIAHALSAEGTPYQVKKRNQIAIGEFRNELLFGLNEDEMICIERNKWLEKE